MIPCKECGEAGGHKWNCPAGRREDKLREHQERTAPMTPAQPAPGKEGVGDA